MSLEEPLISNARSFEAYGTGFAEVLREEGRCIKGQRAARATDEEGGEPGQPFSLAFSGGGIRAAAFQCGVLWRLAEANKLKDVEYFTAVSGGGYITSAFTTHLLAKEPPQAGEEVKQWYLDVVAQTVCRMQANAGDFVRDCVKQPMYSTEGAGVLPRFLDLPMLLLTLLCTLLVNPLTFVVVAVVPVTINIEMFFGAAMRSAFCAPPGSSHTWWDFFWDYSPFKQLLYCTGASVLATTVVFVLRMMPTCKLLPRDEDGKRPSAPMGYLLGHAAGAVLTRLTLALLVLIVFLFLVPGVQVYSYSEAGRVEACNSYINGVKADPQVLMCSDATDNGAWYGNPIFNHYTAHADLAAASKGDTALLAASENPTDDDDTELSAKGDTRSLFQAWFGINNLIYLFGMLFVAFLGCAICIMPVFGSHLLVNALVIAGPLLLLVMLLAFVQYCVFGPITHNKQGLFSYSRDRWENFATGSLTVAFLILPFYEELRATLHTYYKRCLQVNFFKDGKDRPFKAVAEHPYCPFVILTGTSSDFQPPGDTDVISELSFSALHTGSEETGYLPMPGYRSLGKCTALTGAGCLDAISLSMSDALSMRFWLEVLNLSWGDYILFQAESSSPRFESLAASFAERFGWEWEGTVTRFLHRLPSGVVWFLTFVWLHDAWRHARGFNDEAGCAGARHLLFWSIMAILTLTILSFFSFHPSLDWLSLSPLLRQIQQATKYFYVGRRPPRMLYVTDGGVKDCTAIVQLMRRRCERILLVLAASDPNDELAVLKTAMEVAKSEKIGYFYDPKDPRRDVQVLFTSYKKDKSLPYLHVGISYCWDEKPTTGHLFIVKNRLPPDFVAKEVQPLLTEEEIRGEPVEREEAMPEEWKGITTDQLGPFGCCDCCHTNGLNCGPKFPHGSFTGYMYLTPQWINGLARIAHAVSEPAVERITSSDPLCDPWEADIN